MKTVHPRGGFTQRAGKTFWQFVGEGIGVFLFFASFCMVIVTLGNCVGCVDMAEIIHGKADVYGDPP